jgi:ParB family chromosome partitioning protein
MATKKRGLGRGLDALLGGAPAGTAKQPATKAAAAPADSELRSMPVDIIQRGRYQPRHDMHTESLDELADSIRAQGVVQPIVVRPVGKDRYEIIAGERRWRAAQLAGLQEIPVVVRDVPDRAAIAMALIENIQRENLNPMEEAHALQRLIDEFEMTHQQAAEAVGRSRTGVSNLLRLLDLNEDVKGLLEKRVLEMGHARALLGLKGAPQSDAARQVAAKGLSVRETEQLVRRLQQPAAAPKTPPRVDPDIRRLQEDLSEKLGAAVQVQHGPKGKGKLVIQYNSNDELEGILAHIR